MRELHRNTLRNTLRNTMRNTLRNTLIFQKDFQLKFTSLQKSDDKNVLRFSWNLYILYIMYIPITKTEEKCAGQLSYGFNIQDKLEGCTHEIKIQILMGIWIFWILCTNVLELMGGFGRQILQVFTLFF